MSSEKMLSISDKEFTQLADYVKRNYGINLSTKKKTLVMGRLQNVLALRGINSFSEYYNYVISDVTGDAATTLINKLTTNHTFFMRESKHFEYFRSKVLPYLTASYAGQKDLRIWSAGCSTGEEAYTLAMIVAEYFGMEKRYWDAKILATDISSKVLEIAAKGIYSGEQTESLPEKWKNSYLRRLDSERSMFVEDIRNEVIFRKFNLMNAQYPFKKKFHVIFCRNVMIYFDSKVKAELIEKFYEFTEPGGYLFIGHSESLNREDMKYKYVLPAVYRKE